MSACRLYITNKSHQKKNNIFIKPKVIINCKKLFNNHTHIITKPRQIKATISLSLKTSIKMYLRNEDMRK